MEYFIACKLPITILVTNVLILPVYDKCHVVTYKSKLPTQTEKQFI